jgi:hypothetical protein
MHSYPLDMFFAYQHGMMQQNEGRCSFVLLVPRLWPLFPTQFGEINMMLNR